MINNRFIGSWSLISQHFILPDNSIHYPMGQNMLGRINYEKQGTMAAQLIVVTGPNLLRKTGYRAVIAKLKMPFLPP